ncbi:MAG: peptidylprolyl isomerase [Firmicutes bacterium]|nr:peptidylprolyl isomerase [Bacillota bacterium]
MNKKLLIIALALLTAVLAAGCQSDGQTDSDLVEALIVMDNGAEIALELYPEVAPITVENFVNLARQGFYDDLTFHRIVPGFMIQGGCPLGTGMGGPDHRIEGEFAANGHANDLKHERGVISMARSMDFNSAGSQFFIMVDAAPHLDGDYAAFGRVVSGIEEVDAIVNAQRMGETPVAPRHIQTITVSD